MPKNEILISGAGIAGLCLARLLKELQIPFMIIEKREHLATEGAGIALPANAVQALRHIGLGSPIDRDAHQVKEIIYTDTTGAVLSNASLLQSPLNVDRFVALQRHAFHKIICDGIEDQIHFGTSIQEICETEEGVRVKFNNPALKQKEFKAVIGADGIHSQVRQLVFSDVPVSDLGVTIWRWTCSYPTDNLQPTYMLGARDIFMAYPIGKNEVYCYAHVFDPENANSKLLDYKANLVKQFGNHGGVAKTMLEILPANHLIIPGRLRSVSQPLLASGRIALIGDASHACSPMLQQGAASALEDVIALSQLLKHFSVEDALHHYQEFRHERVNWISTSSDGPMKMLINVDMKILSTIQQNIRVNGPLNIQGWKKLLASNFVSELASYIEKNKLSAKQRSGVRLPSKL